MCLTGLGKLESYGYYFGSHLANGPWFHWVAVRLKADFGKSHQIGYRSKSLNKQPHQPIMQAKGNRVDFDCFLSP